MIYHNWAWIKLEHLNWHNLSESTLAKLLARNYQSSSVTGVNANKQCSWYTLNNSISFKAACCFRMCVSCLPLWKLLNTKGKLLIYQMEPSVIQAVKPRVSISNCKHKTKRLGGERLWKPWKQKTSSPKFNSIENDEPTKGFLETGNKILVMEKEQPSSTLSGC